MKLIILLTLVLASCSTSPVYDLDTWGDGTYVETYCKKDGAIIKTCEDGTECTDYCNDLKFFPVNKE